MMNRFRLKDPRTMIRLGFLSLIATNGARFLLLRPDRHFGYLGENMLDGINGVLYGMTIGLLSMGVWLNGRRRTGCGPGTPVA
jgi:hypothetical protein